MKCDKHTMLLYAVTDRAWTGRETLRQQVEDALKGGVTCVQLREKELDDAAFLQEAMELSALCRSYGVPFIINDNVEIAIKCHADGIHVGQEDMAAADVRAKVGPDMIIGVSAHSVEEAQLAVAHGADYLGVGAAFSTHTKTDVDVLPEGRLKEICDSVDVPVVAIGGIHKDNILKLKGSGADGVALVSAIFSAEDIEAECKELKALTEQIIYNLSSLRLQLEALALRKAQSLREESCRAIARLKVYLRRFQFMKTALTIAGSDSSGGAGIQADLKAMTMNGVFAMSAITALTAQNTTGVSGIFEVSPEFLAQQIDAVFTDIRPCAVKIGMVSSAPLIETIAARLRFYKAEHIVVDPVMVATSGSDLIASDAVRTSAPGAVPSGRGHHAQPARGRSAVRPAHLGPCRHERRRPGHRRRLRLCRPAQGRPQ